MVDTVHRGCRTPLSRVRRWLICTRIRPYFHRTYLHFSVSYRRSSINIAVIAAAQGNKCFPVWTCSIALHFIFVLNHNQTCHPTLCGGTLPVPCHGKGTGKTPGRQNMPQNAHSVLATSAFPRNMLPREIFLDSSSSQGLFLQPLIAFPSVNNNSYNMTKDLTCIQREAGSAWARSCWCPRQGY